jgi:YVTN family beta-propeller protein
MPLSSAVAGQAPRAARTADIPISGSDRVYAADQFSNTVSVIDPAGNRMLGVIRLGDPQPANLSPLYRDQVLVHGLGFSPDGKTLAVVSTGSNSVTFIDTATNAVKATTYLGRSPHEAFFTPDGRELWVTVRGEDYISVVNAATFAEKTRIRVPACRFSRRWRVRLCLFILHGRDRRDPARRSSDRRADQAGFSLLPEHRREP